MRIKGEIWLASTTQNIGCPSTMTPSKMGKTKYLIFYSLIKAKTRHLKWVETSKNCISAKWVTHHDFELPRSRGLLVTFMPEMDENHWLSIIMTFFIQHKCMWNSICAPWAEFHWWRQICSLINWTYYFWWSGSSWLLVELLSKVLVLDWLSTFTNTSWSKIQFWYPQAPNAALSACVHFV